MTYPQQQYAPQGYAPQQYAQPSYQQYPPAAAPQQYQQTPPAYGHPAAGPGVPQQGGQALPATPPALGQTRGAGGGVSPKARHLLNRTIIIEPIRVDENATAPDGKARPEAYFHLTVCDGGPLLYGDSQDRDPAKQRPYTHRIETPCRFTNVSDYGYGFVNEVRDAIARGDMAAVGVFEQGTTGNRPYLLTKPGRDLAGNDRPDGESRFQVAQDLWNRIFAKDLSWNPQPVSLVAPPQQAPQQVSYQPQTAPAGYAPQQQYAFQPHPMGNAHGPGDQNGYYVQPQQGGYNPAAYAPTTPAPAQQQYAPPVPQPGPSAFAQAAAPEIAAMGNPVQAAYGQAQNPAMDPGYAAYLAQQQAGTMPGAAPPQAGPGM